MSGPIGVFDSGVGGLTVLRALVEHFPTQDFIYLGDTARLPYGAKSPETILKYTEQNLKFLDKMNVQAFVIACNSASSQFHEKTFNSKPVYTVIEPGAISAINKTENQRIGLIATRATIRSRAYQNHLHQFAREKGLLNLKVFEQATPLLVPLAEEGWTDDPITNLICYRYLQPLLLNEIDVLIMGCTHYPLLKSSLQKVCGSRLELVDSSDALVSILKKDISDNKIIVSGTGELELHMTDLSEHLQNLSQNILQKDVHFKFAELDFSTK